MELFHVAVFCTSFVGGYLFHYVREKVRRKTIRDLVRDSFHPDGFTLEHSTNRIKHQVSEEVAREVTDLFKQGVVKMPKMPDPSTNVVKNFMEFSERWRDREVVMPWKQEDNVGLPSPKLTVTSNCNGSHLVSVETQIPISGESAPKRGKSKVRKW